MHVENIENAKIISVKLGEEHGQLSATLMLEGKGWCCGFGGYALDHWFSEPGEYASEDGYGAIIELMKALEVDSWEGLEGQYVRVRIGGWGEKIYAIGHLIKDQWFSFDEYFSAVKCRKEQCGKS